ncbi:MAG TPA: oligopeptide transporter, OPT family [Candidatus Acidoferrum sp.]|nr:oligopeptide transporter, OPT family [Candidatus Acidoferrum sp.]
MTELTLRGIALGGLITILFTAANVYLGLKSGLTFATSLPAAVISMALLRFVPNSSILENNIVQTVASAAGTLSAIIFVLPGLIMIGWWQGFPFWTTALVCGTGGVLGVMLSVPLRRALVTGSSLPYPEGAAAAEVLVVGCAAGTGAEDNQRGLRVILLNSLASAGYALLASMKLVAAEAGKYFKVGGSISGVSGGLSFALFGVGHLVGLSAGLAMLLGLVLAWAGLMPYYTFGLDGGVDQLASSIFRSKVRFVGSGMIGIAAIWTLFKLLGPIAAGIRTSLASAAQRARGEALTLTERDIPLKWVVLVIIANMVPIAWLLSRFVAGGPLAPSAGSVIAATLLYVLIAGIVIASVCGYMAGLVGSSNSPISSVGILGVLGASLMLVLIVGRGADGAATQTLVAYALFVTAIVFGVATISNDNLQDLKTGQLIGATPWRQQVALIIGVVFGSLAIPPVLSLLNTAFGFAGTPGAGDNALSAPQAALITALAKGVLGGDLDWSLLGLGAAIGALLVLLDEVLGRSGKLRLPPLAVGMGMYLPMALTTPMVAGALIGHCYDRWAARQRDAAKAVRMGTLLATGMIVGESLFGVVFAGIVAATGNDDPLAVVGKGFEAAALWLGLAVFAAITYAMYRHAARASA